MALYRCLYEIDLDADSPLEAAEECYKAMQNSAPVITVIPWHVDPTGEELAPNANDRDRAINIDFEDVWYSESFDSI